MTFDAFGDARATGLASTERLEVFIGTSLSFDSSGKAVRLRSWGYRIFDTEKLKKGFVFFLCEKYE
jgi:hypothetical protein